jgi:hypothetical protein
MQASSTAPTVAQQRALEQLRLKLREDLASLNGLLSGDFAAFQQRAFGAGASTLSPVALP